MILVSATNLLEQRRPSLQLEGVVVGFADCNFEARQGQSSSTRHVMGSSFGCSDRSLENGRGYEVTVEVPS